MSAVVNNDTSATRLAGKVAGNGPSTKKAAGNVVPACMTEYAHDEGLLGIVPSPL